jgi:hypothetical protein
MSTIQSPDATDATPSGNRGMKRGFSSCDRAHKFDADEYPARRRSTVLNPRLYFKDELWQQAPVLTGNTKFDPLPDARNILITGGAGFMYVKLRTLQIL